MSKMKKIKLTLILIFLICSIILNSLLSCTTYKEMTADKLYRIENTANEIIANSGLEDAVSEEREIIRSSLVEFLKYSYAIGTDDTIDELEQIHSIDELDEYIAGQFELTPFEMGYEAISYWNKKTDFDKSLLHTYKYNLNCIDFPINTNNLRIQMIKNNLELIEMDNKKTSRLNLKIRFKWVSLWIWYNLYRILISVILIGTIFSSILYNLMKGVIAMLLIGIFLYIIGKKYIDPWFEKKYIETFREKVKETIIDINSKLFLKYYLNTKFLSIVQNNKLYKVPKRINS